MVKVKDILKNNRLTKVSNGVNIFNAMKAEYNKDNTIKTFVLDMEGIMTVSPFVFKEVVRQMQFRLDGQFRLELANANPLIVNSFKLALNG